MYTKIIIVILRLFTLSNKFLLIGGLESNVKECLLWLRSRLDNLEYICVGDWGGFEIKPRFDCGLNLAWLLNKFDEGYKWLFYII